MTEPVVLLAQTLRPWAHELHMHVMDHGGVRIRGYALTRSDMLRERADAVMVDDVTSFLTSRLVSELHSESTVVVGVYEGGADGEGRRRLLAMGADVALDADSPPELMVAELIRVCAREMPVAEPVAAGAAASQPAGIVVAVGSAGGGCGATEVSIVLADELAETTGAAILVDADDQSPGVAPRLDLEPHPGVLDALAALAADSERVGSELRTVRGLKCRVLTGIHVPIEWDRLRPDELAVFIAELAASGSPVVVNLGGRAEELPGAGRLARFGTTRALLGLADRVVLVTAATPRGVRLAGEWALTVRGLVEMAEVELVLNQHAGGRFTAAELAAMASALEPRTTTLLPYDRRVLQAEWDGTVVARGPFRRASRGLAATVLERTL